MGFYTVQVPDPFPGAIPPFRDEQRYGTKAEIQGEWFPSQDNLSSQQFQRGRGVFTCAKQHVGVDGQEVALSLDDVLENPKTKERIKLIGNERSTPDWAVVPLETWLAEIVDRP